MTVDQLLHDAMELSPDERAALAYTLIDTLDDAPATSEEVGRVWAEEVQRRREAIRKGDVQLIPWDEARERLRRDLAERRCG